MNEIQQLVDQLETYNRAYRAGQPLVSDQVYDDLVEQLRVLDPRHPFLTAVEPEAFSGRGEVRHTTPMLSLEKAYTDEQLNRFFTRLAKEAAQIGIDPVIYRALPKLDGLAGRDDGQTFATRGNGYVGYEISSAFAKGVVALGGRGQGLGEIVVVQAYFEQHLADKFEHPRNMVVGIISSDTLNEDARQALEEGQVRFVPYRQLASWEGTADAFKDQAEHITADLAAETPYPMDGIVLEVVDEALRSHLGATAHHHRWQIALKRKGQTAETLVQAVQWQVGRTGSITPVLEVEPVNLSGATIRRVTAHHAGMILKHGPGTRIEIIRSGEVIPKMEKVLSPAAEPVLPEACPACGRPLAWRGDFLRCDNTLCPAQIEQRLSHWFKTLGNADWFGIKTVEKMVGGGFDALEKVYAMTEADFTALGFGPVQSVNLAQALQTSRTKPVEDWRFLAAFGIPDLGLGDSRRLLEHIPLEALPEAQPEQIVRINGFGEKTSQSIVGGLQALRSTFHHMLDLEFALEKTPLAAERKEQQSAISGKKIVFTGKMVRGSREEMQARARELGAVVQSAVSGSTDLLVCGEKVGQSKLQKAQAAGVAILAEDEYGRLIGE
jgi:DNA ligase (NAD+)